MTRVGMGAVKLMGRRRVIEGYAIICGERLETDGTGRDERLCNG